MEQTFVIRECVVTIAAVAHYRTLSIATKLIVETSRKIESLNPIFGTKIFIDLFASIIMEIESFTDAKVYVNSTIVSIDFRNLICRESFFFDKTGDNLLFF